MLMSTIIGFLLSVVAFSTLVVGDPSTVITLRNHTITNNPNDYWEPWTVEIKQVKKDSLVTGVLHAKKQLPDTMQMLFMVQISDQDPIEFVVSLCDALHEELIGKSFVAAGMPKDEFPKDCPIEGGNWSIVEWNPPTHLVPPGIKGPITGKINIMEDGKDPYVIIEYEGEISHAVPGLGI